MSAGSSREGRDYNDGVSRSDAAEVGVVIGLRDVYMELREVVAGYHRLELKLDAALNLHTIQFDDLATKYKGHATTIHELEARLRAIEQRPVVTPRAMWTSVSVFTGVAGTIIAFISALIRGA